MGRGETERAVELPEVERSSLDGDLELFEGYEERRARKLIRSAQLLCQGDRTSAEQRRRLRLELPKLIGQVTGSLDDELQETLADPIRHLLDDLLCCTQQLQAGNLGSWLGNRLAQLSVFPPSPHLIFLGGQVHARERISDRLTICGALIPDEQFSGQQGVSRDERWTFRSSLCPTCAAGSRQLANSHPVNKAYWEKTIGIEGFTQIMRPVVEQALRPTAKETFQPGGAFDGYCQSLYACLQISMIDYAAGLLLSLPADERRRRLFSTTGMDEVSARAVRRFQRAVRDSYPQEPAWPSRLKLSRLLEKTLPELPADESMGYHHAAAFIVGGTVYPKALQAFLRKHPYGFELGFVRSYFEREIAPKLNAA